MSFILAIESLKFYKLKQERVVHVLFLLCFGVNAVNFLFPVGDTDFTNLTAWAARQLTVVPGGNTSLISYPAALSYGNLLFLATQVIILIFNLFVSYFYASAYSAERDGLPAMKGIVAMLRSVPRQLLLILLLLVPAFFSLFLMGIPLIIGALMLLFAPLLIAERKMQLSSAISDSYILTNHRKSYIFFSFVLLSLASSLLEQFLLLFASNNRLALFLLTALLTSVTSLMRGRLIGLCYVFFAKQLQYLSLSQLMNRPPQELIQTILGPDERDKDSKKP